MSKDIAGSNRTSKLTSHLKPIDENSQMYGIKIADMNRDELLQVIQWLVDEMNEYKVGEHKAREQLNNLYLERLA